MSTLFNWIREIYQTKGIADIIDPLDSSKGSNAFTKIPSRSLDGIFILNKGFIIFGNVPIHLLDEETIEREGFWIESENTNGNLLLLFQLLLVAVSNIQGRFLDPNPYFQQFQPEIKYKKI